jgi:tetratricopeptide (TPR) repeat protein
MAVMVCIGMLGAHMAMADMTAADSQATSQPAVIDPQAMQLAGLVRRMLDDPLTDDAQRRRMLVFHGAWDELTDPTPAEQARISWQRYDVTHASLESPDTDLLARARALLFKGEPAAVLALLVDDGSFESAPLRAQALDWSGQRGEAAQLLAAVRDGLAQQTIADAPRLTAAAEALALLAQLEGAPASHYHVIMRLLSKARTDGDPLYWPALLAEGRLLMEKDNAAEAIKALVETLKLNPRCGEAWYLLGLAAAHGFNFAKAQFSVDQLRKINPAHPLAWILEGHMLLLQKDPHGAIEVVEPALERLPRQRDLLALHVAARVLSYDEAAAGEAIDRFNAYYPNDALAHHLAGRYLGAARQYDDGRAMLIEAAARQPNWAAPHIDLGLLLMQFGDEPAARVVLKRAVALDPFHRGASNQLKLVDQLLTFAELRSAHFVVRYKPGVDEVLARDMVAQLESIYEQVTSALQHQPHRTTIIEIMPDAQSCAVRITGLPEIWTIGACMGDVIAITPPRGGPGQHGPFDWHRVIQHEYVHTVTLDQTRNRIPHWLTEACAVWQEPGGRNYTMARLLADALNRGALFKLNEINWAFVRPRNSGDRPLAYAQAHWMLEYIVDVFGHGVVVDMLSQFRDGTQDVDAIETATGQTAEQFMDAFKQWGRSQVRSWGLQPRRGDKILRRLDGDAISPGDLAKIIKQAAQAYPEHPDLLKLRAIAALHNGDDEQAWPLVQRYADARPIDPWADCALAKLGVRFDQHAIAIRALEQLDQTEQQTGQWSKQLATIYQEQQRFDHALRAIHRALHREPYDATYRELAATIAMQAGDLVAALRHLVAMTVLEPDRPIHHVRHAAILWRMDRVDEAHEAALKARDLDANAPVERFFKKAG